MEKLQGFGEYAKGFDGVNFYMFQDDNFLFRDVNFVCFFAFEKFLRLGKYHSVVLASRDRRNDAVYKCFELKNVKGLINPLRAELCNVKCVLRTVRFLRQSTRWAA